MQETGLILRQREKDIAAQIQQMDENHQWMNENGYGQIWTRFRSNYTFLKRYLERTTKKREEVEERERKEREK